MQTPEKIWEIYRLIGYEREIESPHYGKRLYPVKEVREFHNSNAQIKIVTAPARASKSWSASHDVIPDILAPLLCDLPTDHEENKILIVGQQYEHASKEFNYIVNALVHKKDLIGLPGPRKITNQPKLGRLEVYWSEWNTRLVAKSAAQLQSLLGDQWNACILSETAQMDQKIWLQALSTRVKRSIWPTTPHIRGKWIHDFLEDNMDDPTVARFRFPVHANPFYDRDRFENELRRRGPDDPYFREQFLGEFTYYGGRVFPEFQEDPVEDISPWVTNQGIEGGEGHHCVQPFDIPRHWKRLGGMDFGWRDPTVFLFLALSPLGEIIVYDEHYRTQAPMREHMQEMERLAHENGTIPWPPREVYREPRGQSKQIAEDLMVDYGFTTIAGQDDHIAGRQRISDYFTRHGGLPLLRIVRERCPNLVRELTELHYDEPKLRREGQIEHWLGDDHAIDALRYPLMARPVPRRMKAIDFAKGPTLDQMMRRHKERKRRYHDLIGHGRTEGRFPGA